jgi:hypothetical protein
VNENNIEDFFAPSEIDNKEVFITKSLNDSIETEVILWVFKFQQRFQLPDIALEALIKFLRIILIRLNKLRFENFSALLYIAKKLLNIIQPKMQLAVCTSCHKLIMPKKLLHIKKKEKLL